MKILIRNMFFGEGFEDMPKSWNVHMNIDEPETEEELEDQIYEAIENRFGRYRLSFGYVVLAQ